MTVFIDTMSHRSNAAVVFASCCLCYCCVDMMFASPSLPNEPTPQMPGFIDKRRPPYVSFYEETINQIKNLHSKISIRL